MKEYSISDLVAIRSQLVEIMKTQPAMIAKDYNNITDEETDAHLKRVDEWGERYKNAMASLPKVSREIIKRIRELTDKLSE